MKTSVFSHYTRSKLIHKYKRSIVFFFIYFSATGEFILMDAVKSEELKKIISLVLASPGMANLLLETSLQLLNDYQKVI